MGATRTPNTTKINYMTPSATPRPAADINNDIRALLRQTHHYLTPEQSDTYQLLVAEWSNASYAERDTPQKA